VVDCWRRFQIFRSSAPKQSFFKNSDGVEGEPVGATTSTGGGRAGIGYGGSGIWTELRGRRMIEGVVSKVENNNTNTGGREIMRETRINSSIETSSLICDRI
jgi:hypothetical protein